MLIHASEVKPHSGHIYSTGPFPSLINQLSHHFSNKQQLNKDVSHTILRSNELLALFRCLLSKWIIYIYISNQLKSCDSPAYNPLIRVHFRSSDQNGTYSRKCKYRSQSTSHDVVGGVWQLSQQRSHRHCSRTTSGQSHGSICCRQDIRKGLHPEKIKVGWLYVHHDPCYLEIYRLTLSIVTCGLAAVSALYRPNCGISVSD